MERRSESRYQAVTLAAELLLDDSSVQPVDARDLGKGGVCFLHSAPVPPAERRRMRLMANLGENRFSEPLVITVRIAWCTEIKPGVYQIGAAFDTIDHRQRGAIETLIYLLTRDVAEEKGRLRFRTGLVPVVERNESDQ